MDCRVDGSETVSKEEQLLRISGRTVTPSGIAISFNFEPTIADAVLYADDSVAEGVAKK